LRPAARRFPDAVSGPRTGELSESVQLARKDSPSLARIVWTSEVGALNQHLAPERKVHRVEALCARSNQCFRRDRPPSRNNPGMTTSDLSDGTVRARCTWRSINRSVADA
jgi:hypothetical protein